MTEINNDDEIPVVIENSEKNTNSASEEQNSTESSDKQTQSDEEIIKNLTEELEKEKQKSLTYEDKLKHTLADYQNLERKTKSDIENGVNEKIDKFLLDFLQIYDDFVRAKEVAAENKIVSEGFDSILKNMNSLLTKYGVVPIDAIGEIFNPNFHEAISVIEDDSLDENTITKEIRKGYISHQRVIRPALVEISKKSKSE
ncbi:MAG: nucleotide exchange factor GrpE [Nitrosopumilaceae archaeon]|nr:nucleotide exchange factor GrpE [Nitrosopumilaceae archaeon]